jgi:hypothetical protein
MGGTGSCGVGLACPGLLKRQCNASGEQRAWKIVCKEVSTGTWHAHEGGGRGEGAQARWDPSPPLIAVVGEQLTCRPGTSGGCEGEAQCEVTRCKHGTQGLEALERQGGGGGAARVRWPAWVAGLLLASMTHCSQRGADCPSSAGLC